MSYNLPVLLCTALYVFRKYTAYFCERVFICHNGSLQIERECLSVLAQTTCRCLIYIYIYPEYWTRICDTSVVLYACMIVRYAAAIAIDSVDICIEVFFLWQYFWVAFVTYLEFTLMLPRVHLFVALLLYENGWKHVVLLLSLLLGVLLVLLPRCMQCRRGLAMRILSVRLSVCPSVTRVICDKMEERSVQIYIPYERTFIPFFWEEEWLVAGDPFYVKFWVNRPPLEKNRRFSTNNRS